MAIDPLHPDKLINLRGLGQTYIKAKGSYHIQKPLKTKAPGPAGKSPGLIERLAYKLHEQRQEQTRRG